MSLPNTRIYILPILLFSTACAAGDGTLEEIDPEAAPQNPTYSQHVAPLMDEYCNACHSTESQFGPSDGYVYDTCDDVKRGWRDLVETTFDEKTMPPGGAVRMREADILTLQRWYDQGARCDE